MKIKSDYIFYIGMFFLAIATMCVNIVYMREYLTYIKLVALVLLMLSAFIKIKNLKIPLNQFLIMVVMLIVGIFSYFSSKDFLLLTIFLVLISSMNIDFEKIVKCDLFIKIVVSLFVIINYFAGNTDSIEIHRTDGLLRYSFGFFHPNTFSLYLVFMYFNMSYLQRKKITARLIVLGCVCSYIVLRFADSKTAFLINSIFLIYLVFKKQIDRLLENKRVVNQIKNLFVYFFLLSFLLTISKNLIGDEFFEQVDSLFSGRLSVQLYYLENFKINLFGNDVEYVRSLDNAYIRMLLSYGICGVFIFSYISANICRRAYKNDDGIIILMFFLISTYGLMENLIYNPILNVFMIYFSKCIAVEGKDFKYDIGNCSNI